MIHGVRAACGEASHKKTRLQSTTSRHEAKNVPNCRRMNRYFHILKSLIFSREKVQSQKGGLVSAAEDGIEQQQQKQQQQMQ
jgi:hypothetical protein